MLVLYYIITMFMLGFMFAFSIYDAFKSSSYVDWKDNDWKDKLVIVLIYLTFFLGIYIGIDKFFIIPVHINISLG